MSICTISVFTQPAKLAHILKERAKTAHVRKGKHIYEGNGSNSHCDTAINGPKAPFSTAHFLERGTAPFGIREEDVGAPDKQENTAYDIIRLYGSMRFRMVGDVSRKTNQ